MVDVRRVTIEELEHQRANHVPQRRWAEDEHCAWDLIVGAVDLEIMDRMEVNALDWDEVTTTGRGVEITKHGDVLKCPYCGTWNNIGRKRKGGGYYPKTCSFCEQSFETEHAAEHRRIIGTVHASEAHKPIILGENINRYRVLQIHYIDTKYSKLVPGCPHCGRADPNVDPESRAWACSNPQCLRTYTRGDVREVIRVGINYKDPKLYAGDKIIVRKTGRGIYATIDILGACTTQVAFIFKPREDRAEPFQPLRLEYILGVLNSRLMLYYHYKKTGEVEWRSFPYVTQKVIKKLPIWRPDFDQEAQALLHDQIADRVRATVERGTPPSPAEDGAIEQLVRQTYGLTVEQSTHVDRELKKLEEYGPLLGSREEEQEEELEGQEQQEARQIDFVTQR